MKRHIPDDMHDKDICHCELCGCIGNATCGHDPLDSERMCTLDPVSLVCPCCSIDPSHMDAVGTTDAKQEVLPL